MKQLPERRLVPAEIRRDERELLDEVCHGTAHLERTGKASWCLTIGDVTVWFSGSHRIDVHYERSGPGKWCMRPEESSDVHGPVDLARVGEQTADWLGNALQALRDLLDEVGRQGNQRGANWTQRFQQAIEGAESFIERSAGMPTTIAEFRAACGYHSIGRLIGSEAPTNRGCSAPEKMGEFACKDRSQCWEPCGELGNDDAHVRVAPQETSAAVDRALGITKATRTLRGLLIEARGHLEGRTMSQLIYTRERLIEKINAALETEGTARGGARLYSAEEQAADRALVGLNPISPQPGVHGFAASQQTTKGEGNG